VSLVCSNCVFQKYSSFSSVRCAIVLGFGHAHQVFGEMCVRH
jgi:hypothetical protein